MTLCLLAGTLAVALGADGRFTLEWTHSVEREAWRETWQLTERGLELRQAAIKGAGAGMEPGQGGHFEGAWWVWAPEAPPVPELALAASGETVSGWQLCAEGACVTLGREAGETILLRPCGG